jgi:hypothetical protein
MADRVILAVKYTPVGGQLRKAVGGFLRYIHYRDKHAEPEPDRQVEGMLKYVAHRDHSSSKGLLFDRQGSVDDAERRQLADFVARSVKGSKPQLQQTRSGELVERRRAVYRFVLSPEQAQGLNLHQLTRSAMDQLESELGGQTQWIAAEHRNTRHPHVHIVMAGLREVAPGNFRSVLLTRGRLERMKQALVLELQRQRETRPLDAAPVSNAIAPAAQPTASGPTLAPAVPTRSRFRPIPRPKPDRVRRRVTMTKRSRHSTLQLRVLRSLAARYGRQQERLAEEERRRTWAEGRGR